MSVPNQREEKVQRADSQKLVRRHDKSERTLYVTNFDERVTEELLYELMIQAGPVQSITVIRADNHRYAFVVFEDKESVPYTIKLFRNVKFFGRHLSIKARDTEQERKLKSEDLQRGNVLIHQSLRQYPTQQPTPATFSTVPPNPVTAPGHLIDPWIARDQFGLPHMQPQSHGQWLPLRSAPPAPGLHFGHFPTVGLQVPSNPVMSAPPLPAMGPFNIPALLNPFHHSLMVPSFNYPSHHGPLLPTPPVPPRAFPMKSHAQDRHTESRVDQDRASESGYGYSRRVSTAADYQPPPKRSQGKERDRKNSSGEGGKFQRWRRMKRK